MKHFTVTVLFLFLTAALFAADPDNASIPSVENLDLVKFSGKWYEIARLPTPFEEGLIKITSTYTVLSNGTIEVLNEGIKDGKPSSIRGRAWYPDPKKVSRMMISFFLWFASDYIVIDMDPEGKNYLLVTGRTKNSFWVFSRTPKMEAGLYRKKLDEAEKLGFDLSRLIEVPQE